MSLKQRWALGIEYDGRAFLGWQSQPCGRTVQDALEMALRQIAGESLRTHPLGRTDTGVHARLQIVHFDTTVQRPGSAWVRGVNALLPRGVAVLWATAVSGDFHARASATGRHYQYLLQNSAVRPGLEAGRVGWYHRPLDLEAMRAAATLLSGRHDFSAFRAAACQAQTPVRELRRVDIQRQGEYLVFSFSANAFLHHMVRNLVGSLVHVGNGRHPPQWLGEVLGARDRARAAPTFGPDGLYLIGGDFPNEWGLPQTLRPWPWMPGVHQDQAWPRDSA
ncbi:MAG: tRNA pseudouridine(38-40) synthase TruA [Betaproteobacteria bacterium]|nr:tRNA pseudouridine(38-40) synthase TruA [Betaproteobacteria bacterium]